MLTFSSLSSNLFILLLGFVFGNLFPTFFGEFLGKIFTPLFLLISLESFNYFYYSKKSGLTFWIGKENSVILSSRKNKRSRSVQNSLKIGFLFGLFVDAFKVGS